MQAVAHNREFAKRVGVPQSIGEEFSEADKAKEGVKAKMNRRYGKSKKK